MANKYLDDAGLSHFWGKVKIYFLGGSSPDDPADTTNCPKMDGARTYGDSHILAREDHVHPTDTSRAPLASPAFTGTPTAPTASSSTDSTQIATTAFVHDVVDNLSTGVTGVKGDAESTYRTGNVNITPANLGLSSGSVWYGTSSTTASTSEKAVTCADFDYKAGSIIAVLFTTANTAATPTLNVNSKGAKSVLIGTAAGNSGTNVLKWSANTILLFMYDGTNFIYLTAVAAASVNPPRGANTWYGVCSTSASTAAKIADIDNFVLTKGAVVVLQMTTANTNTGNITLNVNSTGVKDIVVGNAVTSSSNSLTWAANDVLVFAYDGNYWRFAATIYDDFTGATGMVAGKHGLVPAPGSAAVNSMLFGDSDWDTLSLATEAVSGYRYIHLYRSTAGSSTQMGGAAIIPEATTSANGMMSAADKTKLDSISMTNNIIDASCLPSYVDDVVEVYARTGQTELSQDWFSATSASGSALTSEERTSGKIYVLLNSSTNYAANDTFRWSGSTYVKLSSGTGISTITTGEIDTIMAS